MRISKPSKRSNVAPVVEPAGEWLKWCRLCGKRDMASSIAIFSKNEDLGNDTSLATTIGKYFWVNVRCNEQLPKEVCCDCSLLLTSLVAFTERVNKVQAMFCLLQNTSATEPVDPNEVRVQYGLVDEDWQHMMHRPDITENAASVAKEEEEVIKVSPSPSTKRQRKGAVQAKTYTNDEDVSDRDAADDEDGEITFELTNETGTVVKRINPRRSDRRRSATKKPEITIEFEEAIEQSPADHEAVQEDFVGVDASAAEAEEANDPEAEDPNEAETEEGENEEEADESEEEEEPEEEDADSDEKTADEVDDSDLFKEFKYTEDGDIYEMSEGDADSNESMDAILMEGAFKRKKAAQPVSVTPVPGREDALQLLKRKRGRPPKSSYATPAKLLKKTNSETEGDGDSSLNDTAERKYECSICGRQYKNPTSYRKHMMDLHMTTPDIPDFVCEKCPDRTFPTERQLAAHKRTHLPLVDKLDIPCPYCDKKFTKVAVMRQHVNGTHYNEKPYICDVCGRALKTLAALNEHKLVHTNDCPYECDVCHKSFKNKARLKVHSDIHTDTTYICTICSLSLNTRRTLKMHMLVHSTEKQYKCNFCPSAFKRSKALKNHLILHTGMRPYKCAFCEKSFSNGSNCRSHKRKMHPKELADEEATGKKADPISVPKLEELRVSTGAQGNPREKVRSASGLPAHLRALLIKAEMAAKKAAEGGTLDKDSTFTEIDMQNYDQAIAEMIVENEDDDDDDGEEGEEEDGEGGDEEEGETVIYEIIDEI